MKEYILLLMNLYSIGNFILNGRGVTSDDDQQTQLVRLIDGVITSTSLRIVKVSMIIYLDYPVYTKPREFRGMEVPEVLTKW